MKLKLGFTLALMALMTLMELGSCDTADKEDFIKIGSALSTTGDLSGIGSDMLDAANLAVEEINAAGGVLGKKLRLVHRDTGSDEGKATAAAEALKTEGVVAVVGAVGSGYTTKVVDVLDPAGIPQISPSSTSPALTGYDANGYFFRTCPSDALQGKLLANRAKAAGYTKVAVIHVPGAYGQKLAEAFRDAFEAGGGTVTDFIEYKENETSYTATLTTVFAKSPEALILPVYPVDGAQIVKDYLQGFAQNDSMLYFADAVANQEFVDLVGADKFTFKHEGTAPTTTGPNSAHFVAAYKARYNEDAGAFLANAYDAVYLIALAIEKAGAADSKLVRDSLPSVSAGGTAYGPQDIAAAIKAIDAGEDVNYEGASGSVDFDAQGDVVAPYDIWQVKDGAVSVTEPQQSP